MVLPPIDPEIGERQTLKKIREWYRGMVEALADQRAAVQHAIRTGSPVGGRFDLMTESNVEDYYDTQR